jgi:hypothetical protein
MVYYWVKNGEMGENFRRKDMVFECFHNFLAFSQWGNTLYNIMARLESTNGDATVRSWFEKTMKKDPDDNPCLHRLTASLRDGVVPHYIAQRRKCFNTYCHATTFWHRASWLQHYGYASLWNQQGST